MYFQWSLHAYIKDAYILQIGFNLTDIKVKRKGPKSYLATFGRLRTVEIASLLRSVFSPYWGTSNVS